MNVTKFILLENLCESQKLLDHQDHLHPSIFSHLSGLSGSSLSTAVQTSPPLHGEQRGVSKPAERNNLSSMSWLCPPISHGIPHPGSILVSICWTNCLLSLWKNNRAPAHFCSLYPQVRLKSPPFSWWKPQSGGGSGGRVGQEGWSSNHWLHQSVWQTCPSILVQDTERWVAPDAFLWVWMHKQKCAHTTRCEWVMLSFVT